MRRTVLLIIAAIMVVSVSWSHACVGRILNIGIVDSANENLFAELISVLISERTGTTVNVRVFDSFEDIYEAVKKDDVHIVIENTAHALRMMNIKDTGDDEKDYDLSKNEFRERLNLIWLKPFGALNEKSTKKDLNYSAVITENVLINFPALPRVINKLRGISEDTQFTRAVSAAASGQKIRRIARDYLRKKKLI